LEIRTDPKDARRIQAQLEKLIQSFQKGEEKPGAKRYRFTLAFYPIDVEP
jgi:hypothetical protein